MLAAFAAVRAERGAAVAALLRAQHLRPGVAVKLSAERVAGGAPRTPRTAAACSVLAAIARPSRPTPAGTC
jgi:hypothetical protein